MQMPLRRRVAPDLALILILLLAPLMMFHQQTVGGRTLLPSENLYQFLPYSAYRDVVRAPATPHNALLSDMVLQNLQWKSFIRAQISQGEIPLWNPHQFAGTPFFAAGQHSALYPLSIVYYVLPLSAGYGWFILLNLWLAGLFMAGFLRSLGINRAGAGLAGLVYQLSGFLIANAVFPMIVAAAVWLPLILWMVENILRGRSLWIFRGTALLWVVIGAIALGCNILAGHVELTIYTLLISGYYAAFRLVWECMRRRRETGTVPLRWAATSSLWLIALVLLGLGLAALQLIPLYEFVQSNWRAERSSLETVRGYAHPIRDVLQFLLPNFYGSPAHHSYVDAFSGELITNLRATAGLSRDYIYWGIKNYVEGALYVGVLPLILAAYGLVTGIRWRLPQAQYLILFGALALMALSFMFGTPTYSLVFQLPGMNQLNSPFRWVFALTLAIAVMAGIGLHVLSSRQNLTRGRIGAEQLLGTGLLAGGLALALGTAILRYGFEGFEPLFDGIVQRLARAGEAFTDGRMFFSYQLPQVLILAVVLLMCGVVFMWAARKRSTLWIGLALGVTAVDLLVASYGFNPASDPLLLDFHAAGRRVFAGARWALPGNEPGAADRWTDSSPEYGYALRSGRHSGI